MILRCSLLALVAASVMGAIIDGVYFPNDANLSWISAISSGIVCLYFFVSRRVRYVFDDWSGAWDYDAFKGNSSSVERERKNPSLEADKTKKCPACAEYIKAEAIKCRYCGERLSAESVPTERPKRELTPEELKGW